MKPETFTTHSLPVPDQFDAWRDWLHSVFDVIPREPLDSGCRPLGVMVSHGAGFKANAYQETDAGSCACPAPVRYSAPGIAARVPVVLYWRWGARPQRHQCATVRVVRTCREAAARDEHYHVLASKSWFDIEGFLPPSSATIEWYDAPRDGGHKVKVSPEL
jgi:hypothetical protein